MVQWEWFRREDEGEGALVKVGHVWEEDKYCKSGYGKPGVVVC
jgi:hypothetical protein